MMSVASGPPPLDALVSELRALLDEELQAGNRMVECRTGLYSPDAVIVLLGAPFRVARETLPAGVIRREIDDPHWWKAEYFHPATKHCLACRF